MNTRARRVAMFDSGLGGLSVFVALRRLMPDVDVIYAADTARVPYGDRPLAQVEGFSRGTIARLRVHDPSLLIIACGTTCSAFDAVGYMPNEVATLAIVDCGVRAALGASRHGRIGVIATAATINSGIFERKLKTARADVRVTAVAAPKLVPLVESGEGMSDAAAAAVDQYCEPLRDAQCDTVILGCTHYPLLALWFERSLSPSTAIVDPALSCAQAAVQLLSAAPPGTGKFELEVTGDERTFAAIASRLSGIVPTAVRHVDVLDQVK